MLKTLLRFLVLALHVYQVAAVNLRCTYSKQRSENVTNVFVGVDHIEAGLEVLISRCLRDVVSEVAEMTR